MARLTTNQCFSSVKEIATTFRVILPKPHDWRLIPQPVVGEINGLPTMRGVVVATNGIICAIMTNGSLIFGHLEHFVADEQEQEKNLKTKPITKKVVERDTSEFI